MEYAEAITKSMGEKSEGTTDALAAETLLEARIMGNKVQYLHVETPITKTKAGSTVSVVKISEFDMKPKN